MVRQMAVFMENRKGRILKLTEVLKENGIDLLSLSVADTKDFGILRMIARDNEKAEKVLRGAGFTVTTTELIGIEVEDRPGGLFGVLELLDAAGINIEYLYSHAHKKTAAAMIFVKVSNESAALELLKKKGLRILEQCDL